MQARFWFGDPESLLAANFNVIPGKGNQQARVEVKSAAFVQIWDIKHPEHADITIAPAVMPDETGDYTEGVSRQRNNDV